METMMIHYPTGPISMIDALELRHILKLARDREVCTTARPHILVRINKLIASTYGSEG